MSSGTPSGRYASVTGRRRGESRFGAIDRRFEGRSPGLARSQIREVDLPTRTNALGPAAARPFCECGGWLNPHLNRTAPPDLLRHFALYRRGDVAVEVHERRRVRSPPSQRVAAHLEGDGDEAESPRERPSRRRCRQSGNQGAMLRLRTRWRPRSWANCSAIAAPVPHAVPVTQRPLPSRRLTFHQIAFWAQFVGISAGSSCVPTSGSSSVLTGPVNVRLAPASQAIQTPSARAMVTSGA